MPTSLGPAEILVILVVALIVLGPKRLPEAGRQVGKAIAEVRKWSQGFQDEIRSTIDPDASRPTYPPMAPQTAVPVVTPEPSPPAEVESAPSPSANGSAVTTGSHGLVSGPPPADPLEPPGGEPPSS